MFIFRVGNFPDDQGVIENSISKKKVMARQAHLEEGKPAFADESKRVGYAKTCPSERHVRRREYETHTQ